MRLLPFLLLLGSGAQETPLEADYARRIHPLAAKYCLDCHSHKDKKGDLDLQRFATITDIRKDLRPWPLVVEMLENGEMPPKKSLQPSPAERKLIAGWTRDFLDAEARARAGDPGRVLVRRLNNTEYDHTIRDLTGVDLQPSRDFPVDGAAGEGFANVGDALVLSPALLGKYLNAAKEIGTHLVLLPDGFRFSPAKTRRDWTDESVASLRAFYKAYSADGQLPLQAALKGTPAFAKYAATLRAALEGTEPSFPLDLVRARWRAAPDSLLPEVAAWQKALWKFNKVGSYAFGRDVRQEAADPAFVASHALKVELKPLPGQDEVVLQLSALEFPAADGRVLWKRPRFEGAKGEALLLRDYATYGARYELSLASAFAETSKYLDAARETGAVDEIAKARGLDPEWLRRWIGVLGLQPLAEPGAPGTLAPAVALDLLDTPVPGSEKHPAIKGWRSKGGELPVVLSNGSDKLEFIPGRASPHKIVVHPLPDRFVAVTWESPLDGRVRVDAAISHAHGGCGNGVAWWVEFRRGEGAARLSQGAVNVAGETSAPPRELGVKIGDRLLLAIDAKDGSHVCDLTEINLTVRELEGSRTWNLAADVADRILEGNPHGPWRFVHGPTGKGAIAAGLNVPADSTLGRWRSGAATSAEVQTFLTGPRPKDEKSPNRKVYDALVVVDGPLFRDFDLSRLPRAKDARFGPEGLQFSGDDLAIPTRQTITLRLPAALLRQRPFAVEGALPADSPDRVIQCSATLGAAPKILDSAAPCLARPGSEAAQRLLAGLAEFRRLFPKFICFPQVIPDDEVVCLKLYHRDDEPLVRLFLDETQIRRLDRLWAEHRFISQWPSTEHQNLPLFIGFVTQDGTKEALAFFQSLREPFAKRAEIFEKEIVAAAPAQLEAMIRFAARAYRRPLTEAESAGLRSLYTRLRKEELPHEEALSSLLKRILASPTFLFRLEETPPGADARPVSDLELATRLSYFLWASTPDEELSALAREGKLQNPEVLAAQTTRLLKDPKARGLALEFGTRWLHIRELRRNREKNEKLFPTFNDELRDALFEESIRFFQHLFREGRPVDEILTADYVFANGPLAKHYGIPGVTGPEWRKVDGVRKYGRGGVLGLGGVLAQESGASRTSPVLRGNWVVDTLLGEKLPKPPANVPQLPQEEGGQELSVRELTAKHTRLPECASCHVRIDPFGFALEPFDAIGRLREKDLSGRAVDAAVKLRDGTEFAGPEGLRTYLTQKRLQDFRRTFIRKLLGYALGRSVTLSDQALVEGILKELDHTGLEGVVRSIVGSKQFREHRAFEATRGE